MSPSQQRIVTALALLVAAGAVAWWAVRATTPPAVTAEPSPTANQPPLQAPVVETLKTRTIDGDLPVRAPSDVHRSDPFAK